MNENRLIIFGHSRLLYFWPVWSLSLLYAAITAWCGVDVVVTDPANGVQHYSRMVTTPWMGYSFLVVLFMVLLSTMSESYVRFWGSHFHPFLSLFLAGLGVLLLKVLGAFHFYLSTRFYLWFGVLLFDLWLYVIFAYDRRRYVIVEPHQLTIVEAGHKQIFEANSFCFAKTHTHCFLHGLLGLGTGDLCISRKIDGLQREVVFPNVLFYCWKLSRVCEILEAGQHNSWSRSETYARRE